MNQKFDYASQRCPTEHLKQREMRPRDALWNISNSMYFVGLDKIKYNYSSIFEMKFKIYLNNDTKSVNFWDTLLFDLLVHRKSKYR